MPEIITQLFSNRGKIYYTIEDLSQFHELPYNEYFDKNIDNILLSFYHNKGVNIDISPLRFKAVHKKKEKSQVVKKYKTKAKYWFLNKFNTKKNKYIIDKCDFSIALNKLVVTCKLTNGNYFTPLSNPDLLKWTFLFIKASKEYQEIQLKVNSSTNEIIEVPYPPVIEDYDDIKWDNKFIRKWHRKSSKIELPGNEDLKRIDELLDFYSFVFVKYKDEHKWYFLSVNKWNARRLSRLWGKTYVEFDTNSINLKKHFEQKCVDVNEIRRSFEYLLDSERFDIIKKLAPALLIGLENKEYIANPHNKYGEKVTPFYGWSKKHETFYDLIPEKHQYWVVSGRNLNEEFWDVQ